MKNCRYITTKQQQQQQQQQKESQGDLPNNSHPVESVFLGIENSFNISQCEPYVWWHLAKL